MKFDVTGMSCAACSARVEKAVSAVKGVNKCSVNLLTNSMEVSGDADADDVISAVSKVGYGARLQGQISEKAVKTDDAINKLVVQLVLSAVLSLILMYFSMGHLMLGLPVFEFFEGNYLALGILQMLLAASVMVINQRFFVNGFKGGIHGAPNMDTLVALGSGISFVYSLILLFEMTLGVNNIHSLYFESAAMILTLISVGKMLEAISKGKTTNAIKKLISLKPTQTTVIVNGEEKLISAENVKVDDIFVVRAGESISVDGTVIEGEAFVDESNLTGESLAVEKRAASNVSAGTMNKSGYIKCRATKVGEDTVLAQIIKTVMTASASKAPIAKTADRVAGVFVPAVIGISVITGIIWGALGYDLSFVLERAISVLVISCPCALGLATPVAIMVGSGVGAKHGILYKNASALEEAGRIKTVVLDKTGTITKGSFEVTSIIAKDESRLLQLAYSVESKSEHPLSKAVCKYAKEMGVSLLEPSEFKASVGRGVQGIADNTLVRGGNAEFMINEIGKENLEAAQALAKQGNTPLFFETEKEFLGIIAVADAVKETSRDAVRKLKKLGIKVVMLTGDNEITAKSIAQKVDIEDYKARVLPNEKAEIIRKLKQNSSVAMVGDGVNDAPALTEANLGVAIGAGSDIAIDSADVVLMNSDLNDAVGAFYLGKKVLKNIKENLFWAFLYNCIGIPLAAGIFIFNLGWQLTPMIGAAAMSLSSFCVISNALRLNFIKIKDIKKEKKMKKVVKIGGMMCGHCEARVKKLLEGFAQVDEAIVSHKNGTAILTLNDSLSDEEIKKAVEADGYTFGK